MKVTQGNFVLEMTRNQLRCLSRALKELAILQAKYPDERNGFHCNDQEVAQKIASELEEVLAEGQPR